MTTCGTGVLLEQIVLGIDAGMILVETILNKYIPSATEHHDVMYVRGNRLPIVVTSNSVKSNYVRIGLGKSTPWHPCKAIPILEDLLEYYQYHHTTHATLFESNPISRSNRVYHTSPSMTDNNIILMYVPNITTDDLFDILNIFLELYTQHIKPTFDMFPNNVYRLDATKSTYRLLRYEDIRILRYNEIIENYSEDEVVRHGVG